MKPNKETEKLKRSARYEMNLAEFPIAVLSKAIPEERKTIEYSNWIVGRNGERKRRNWIVTASAKWTLPTGSALRTLFELMQVWKENNIKSKIIPIASRYNLLKRMGASDSKRDSKRDYERVERDLNSLVGITIQAKNAFWDKEAQAYVSKTFHLFEELSLYEQEIKGKERKVQQSLPFAYIKASDIFYSAVKKGNVLTIDSKFFRSLTAPTEQRLALYLTKMLKRQAFHKRDIFKLAHQLPIYSKYPSDIKKTLDKALKGLIDKGFSLLERYYYQRSSDGYREQIIKWMEEDLTGVRIHEELQGIGVKVGYSTVKDYLSKIRKRKNIFVRIHTLAGEEAQVDFGYVGLTLDKQGKRRKT